jgi:hypothetical protein
MGNFQVDDGPEMLRLIQTPFKGKINIPPRSCRAARFAKVLLSHADLREVDKESPVNSDYERLRHQTGKTPDVNICQGLIDRW